MKKIKNKRKHIKNYHRNKINEFYNLRSEILYKEIVLEEVLDEIETQILKYLFNKIPYHLSILNKNYKYNFKSLTKKDDKEFLKLYLKYNNNRK